MTTGNGGQLATMPNGCYSSAVSSQFGSQNEVNQSLNNNNSNDNSSNMINSADLAMSSNEYTGYQISFLKKLKLNLFYL